MRGTAEVMGSTFDLIETSDECQFSITRHIRELGGYKT